MNFNPDAPLDQHALHQGQSILHQLPTLQGNERIHNLYMHWSVGPYGRTYDDYNVCVPVRDGQAVAEITQNPRHNAVDIDAAISNDSNYAYAAHTYHRNSWALGVAVCCMLGATESNFGAFPVTQEQLEVMCAVIGALGHKYNVDVSDANKVMTHAEAAVLDGYFGERWDLDFFSAPDKMSEHYARTHGDMLRKRAHNYKLAMH